MISRFVCKSLKDLAPRAVPIKNLLFKNSWMSFSSNVPSNTQEKLDKATQKLAKAVAREIKYEEDNYQQDDTIHTFLKQHGFTFKDIEGDNNMELSKQVGNVSVNVCFQSRAPQFNEEEDEESQEGQQKNPQGQEGEGEDYPDQDFCDFTVYITQPGGKSLTFECTSFDSEINVNYVSVISDAEAHKKSSKLDRFLGYSSDFTLLDERLQTAILEYLKSYGINEDLALFVEHVSEDKDRRLYLQWLKDVSRFVEH